MVECAKCNRWIHSKCEGLSDEQYQILSMLPESVEFLCRSCNGQSTPNWHKAVKSELKLCFNNVLRLLSKNRMARFILKWSPLNNNTPNCRTITAARKLQFCDENEPVVTEEIDDLQNKNFLKDFPTVLLPKNDGENIKQHTHTASMADIKNKLYSNEYSSVSEFNQEMIRALSSIHSDEVLDIYYSIMNKIFPWYDPQQTILQNDMEMSLDDSSRFEAAAEGDKDEIELQTDVEMPIITDTRMCTLCKGIGDGLGHMESRLLYCGQNEWVHANCALWSSEVYEEIDGSLQNVHSALSRGRSIRCAYCKQKGASVGCCSKGCYETYHFACARTAKCYFMHDKTVYCATHDLSQNSHLIVSTADFDIQRSVYVELDRKKKKIVEIEKVHFMVGSLSVMRLGKIVPQVSDHAEAIVPSGFVCSRLFWSTIEPWKLVSYVITTSILNSQVNTVVLDKNFTVDHSLSKPTVDRKLKDILTWQKDLCKSKSDVLDFEDEEEPQNGTDLLSPELADALLEELPYELLDGISMQDIFQKFTYEELNPDFKTPEINVNDSSEFLKKIDDIEEENDTALQIRTGGRELKRSKSELFPQLGSVDKFQKARGPQRSCSLTLSCKVDSSIAPVIKKRKTAPRDNSMFFQLLQVDGAYDSSSASECGSPTHEPEGKYFFC